MRLRPCLALLTLALFLPAAARAAESRGAGYGATLGEPTGVTAKWWIDKDEACVLGFGVNPFTGTDIQGSADYLLHILESDSAYEFLGDAFSFGLGLRLNGPDDGHVEAGVRLPVGLSWFRDMDRIEWFAEVAPVLDVTPEWEIDLNAVVGVRFYSKPLRRASLYDPSYGR